MKHRLYAWLAIGLLGIASSNSHAVVVTISGFGDADGDWDVSTTERVGIFGRDGQVSGPAPQFNFFNQELFATLSQQVWWGNESLARTFAGAVGISLGVTLQSALTDAVCCEGPLFLYSGSWGSYLWEGQTYYVPHFFVATDWFTYNNVCANKHCGVESSFIFFDLHINYIYATASRVPEPATLGLLGLGLAGVGFAQRKRAAGVPRIYWRPFRPLRLTVSNSTGLTLPR